MNIFRRTDTLEEAVGTIWGGAFIGGLMRKLAMGPGIWAASALALCGCAQQGTEGAKLAAGEKLHITKAVWADYQKYVQQGRGLGADRQGAFGVVLFGDTGTVGLSAYYYCPR